MTFSVHKRAWRNGHVGINFLSNPSKESQSLLNDVISCQIFLIVVADDLNHSKNSYKTDMPRHRFHHGGFS